MFERIRIVAVAALLALPTFALADPITVDPASEGSSVSIEINHSVCSSSAACTADWELSSTLDADTAQLNLGDSWTFGFFDIIVGGLGLVSDAAIEATLNFTSPDAFASSTGNGSYFTFYGLFSAGSLTWHRPDWIALDDGTYLRVSFDDIHDLGFGNRTTVSATVARHSEIPEPATLLLFAAALLGFALTRK